MAQALKKTAPAVPPSDPLLEAINHYKAGGELYDDLPDDLPEDRMEAEFDRLCVQPETVLVGWKAPAKTLESAIAAQRLGLKELEDAEFEPLQLEMFRSVLGFLEELRPS